MSCKIVHPFKNWFTFILANLGLGLIIALAFFNFESSFKSLVIATLWGATIFITQWLGHAYIQEQISKKYDWLTFPKQRFIWTVISIVLYSVFAYAFVQALMSWLILGTSPSKSLSGEMSFWIIPISISFIISMLTGAIGFFSNWKKAELMQEQLKTEMMTYKYEALKNQINPHFMFNSLNVLSELVHEDQDLAVKYIQHFSDMYRYVLESKDHELRPLIEEVAFVEKFIFLLKIRFEDKLVVKMDLHDNSDGLIVPMALQLLLENAVKHNEVSKTNPLAITITKKQDWVIVENKIQLKLSTEPSSKIGLKNLEQQYSFFDQKVIIDKSDDLFTVKIPILKAEKL
jgi:sensor histidine kinase YesM